MELYLVLILFFSFSFFKFLFGGVRGASARVGGNGVGRLRAVTSGRRVMRPG